MVGFRSLNNLCIKTTSSPFVLQLLKMILSSSLISVILNIWGPSPQVHDAESLWKHVALADIMNPLLRQEQLEVLRIRVPSTLLTESDIQDTVTAWPDLRELSLVSGGHESTLPITVLSSFAFHHPSLYSLEMGLVCHIDVQALSSANFFTSHELRQIRLRRRDGEATSPTGKVVLANYLDGLFPRLEMVGTDRFSPPEASSYWDEIAVILNCLQRARARETCRLKGISRSGS